MTYIIETEQQLQIINTFYDQKVFCYVIESSNKIHPALNEPIALYLHPEKWEDGVIINISHPDGLFLDYEVVLNSLKDIFKIYVLDKKQFLYYFPLQNLYDINLLYTLENFCKLDLPPSNKILNLPHGFIRDRRDMNKIIPIVKHYEYAQELFYSIKDLLEFSITDYYTFFNNTATLLFYLIEKEGLGVISSEFIKEFKVESPHLNLQEDTVYTSYNLYNPTSRPTNAFNHINFIAIPHQESYRNTIISKNNKFVEIDFDGYHLRLVADLIGYKLDSSSAHTQLGRSYFGKEDLTQEEYNQTKQINFQALYGKTPEHLKEVDFFKKLDNFVEKLWAEFCEKGEVRVPISDKPITHKLQELYPKKLFNYYLQGLETARNIILLKKLLKYLQNKKTKVVLYVYDSILLDYDETDEIDIISELEKILTENNKFPIRIKCSKTLPV